MLRKTHFWHDRKSKCRKNFLFLNLKIYWDIYTDWWNRIWTTIFYRPAASLTVGSTHLFPKKKIVIPVTIKNFFYFNFQFFFEKFAKKNEKNNILLKAPIKLTKRTYEIHRFAKLTSEIHQSMKQHIYKKMLITQLPSRKNDSDLKPFYFSYFLQRCMGK